MSQHEASRTLVKSPPELWTECSDASSLARHLDGSFGEIRITRLEPETAVAWEGERVSGTVRIEPSGWGTRVTLTAVEPDAPEPEARAPEPEPEPEPTPEPMAEPEPVAEQPAPPEQPTTPERPRSGFFYRMRLLFKPERMVAEEPEPALPPKPELKAPEPELTPAPEPVKPEPVAVQPVHLEPNPTPDASEVLASALESLGTAHHRPFSRG
ncbi:MAG TPA: hypothetical protein VGF81_00060 [Solirubrobacteraceae bacterium]|jgi:hypothetical protein